MLKFGSKSDVTVVHRAIIRLLDDTEIIHCDFQPQHKGKYILEYVCKQLNILETDYFGLRYVDHCKQRHWLDLAKTVTKQVKDMDPILFSFRVKFYPPDPLRLKEEITRYQVYQQLKRDLLHGRLCCSPDEMALLAACIVQSELGDYDPEVHGVGNYLAEHKLLLKQTETIEEKAIEYHQTRLKGCTPEQAETHFLRLASQLDSYAVDPHPVKDHKGALLYLSFNHSGILAFHGAQVSKKISHFRWSEVQKINYEGKMFIVHLTINEDVRTKKKHTVGYKCPTGSNCRHVWRCAIEQMLFFTLPRASDAPVVSGGSIFSWGTKFRYTGRTEREVLEELGPLRKEEPAIQRVNSSSSGSTALRRKASSVPATPSTPSQDLLEIRYSSLPRSCHSAGLDGAGMSDAGGIGLPLSSPYCPDNTLPLLETVSEDQEIHARRNNAVDEKDTHASATHTISVTNHAKKTKLPKSTLNRPQALYSQRIVIGSDELFGHDIEKVVRERIDTLEKSPKVVRSTALIIKSSKVPSKPCSTGRRDLVNGTVSTVDGVGRANHDTHGPANLRPQVSSLSLAPDDLILRNVSTQRTPNGRLLDFTTNGCNHRRSAVEQHERDGAEYYFRDSFEHSSSDSQLLVEAPGKTQSRSRSPACNLQKLSNTKICPRGQQKQRGLDTLRSRLLRRKSLRVIRIFVPALILTITVLFVVIVLIFETDSTLLESLRRSPEMMLLRNRYYVPIKEFLRTKLGLF